MIFLVAHFDTQDSFDTLIKKYAAQYHDDDVICCGTSAIPVTINTNITYHPLVHVSGETDLRTSHQYIDTMMRALQIESPSTIIFHSATKFDSPNVLKRIKEHADIVDVIVVD
jgi:hypothetical protein